MRIEIVPGLHMRANIVFGCITDTNNFLKQQHSLEASLKRALKWDKFTSAISPVLVYSL